MTRAILAALAVLSISCAPAVLTLRISPPRIAGPREVTAVAVYRGKEPIDAVVFEVCQYREMASAEPTDRTFEASFRCGDGTGIPRVSLLRGGHVVASAEAGKLMEER